MDADLQPSIPEDDEAESRDLSPLPAGLFCPECGYDLRTLTSSRCPECGFALEVFRTQEPQIPWVYRRERGRFRTYWQAVWLATFKTNRFCLEIARPVSYADAQRFRWVTILHAWVPIVIASLVLFVGKALNDGTTDLSWWALLSVQACSLLGLAALTGVASYSFHPRHLPVEQQNRAVALSYYSWAPLAFMPLALPLFIAARFGAPFHELSPLIITLLVVAGVVPLLVAFVNNGQFTRRLVRRKGVPRQFGRGLATLLLAGATLLAILILPYSVLYILIIFDSLR